MSFVRVFLPLKENYDELPFKEQQKISNLVIGCLICIPGFIGLACVLVFLYKFVETGSLLFLPCLCFLSALSFIKIGKVKLASYFATFGFVVATSFITFFAPVAEEDALSTFVCYRTCAFCVTMAIINYVFALRKAQLTLFHILSQVELIALAFTSYRANYDHAPILMLSSVAANAIGIFAANMILLFAWKFNEKVLEHSEVARRQVEDLNKNLEDKVAERTKALSESNESLETANKQLEEINHRAERDMALAVNVQRNFYPKEAPEVDGWEIAYIFNPMAGVSGDLFDFYTEGNQFKGCCLFDVSGHGIASGLVTMLSKTVITRQIESGNGKSLAKVMHCINNEIAEDKGDIENYLTGILLRIDGNKVEYVNGAHPALLCRSGTSGKVTPAVLKGDDASGSLIGIRDLPASYTGINFSLKRGDSMLLYTDCLYESRNAEGQEFGAENVAKIFSQVGNGSAQDQLAHLIKQFRDYTGDVPLNDDLTAIILKKL
ncbi:MAG: serine/threonine-protein phosphatase [Treponemataceae bacterium]|nr:serine/threonine-protein phosphatase [Treponemataceae bacterium]